MPRPGHHHGLATSPGQPPAAWKEPGVGVRCLPWLRHLPLCPLWLPPAPPTWLLHAPPAPLSSPGWEHLPVLGRFPGGVGIPSSQQLQLSTEALVTQPVPGMMRSVPGILHTRLQPGAQPAALVVLQPGIIALEGSGAEILPSSVPCPQGRTGRFNAAESALPCAGHARHPSPPSVRVKGSGKRAGRRRRDEETGCANHCHPSPD